MKLRVVEVNDTREEHKRISQLYCEAFPSDERVPYWTLKVRVRQKRAVMYNFFDEDKWVGWIYIMLERDLAYVLFFAIDAECRGQGYGTEALTQILEKYKDYRVYLCLEDWNVPCDNVEERIRRHNFYKKCGMSELPYRTTRNKKYVFSLMYKGGLIPPEEFKKQMYDFAGFPVKYFMNIDIIE
ncbi:hypothetical protein PIROE2DRAFT_10098 [Piromyces sp. E2]|nr:hypothetical protein PIROE2DRAFT_10098 [Piromyces sp. E2]|eukprot:OUM63379.1 hypothetical protein PIROE2DRAFT_10098 [Piromyces sp. E2]